MVPYHIVLEVGEADCSEFLAGILADGIHDSGILFQKQLGGGDSSSMETTRNLQIKSKVFFVP